MYTHTTRTWQYHCMLHDCSQEALMFLQYTHNNSIHFSSVEYTIVVTGCTGRGKSTFCNFLSKSNKFRSDIPGSEMGSGEFGAWGAVAADLSGTQFDDVEDWVKGVKLRIIDLPGYLATQNQTGNYREDLATDGEMVLDEFAKAMMHAKDGVDAILVTLEAGRRFTREEELLMEFISLLQFWDHCILLFTHGDKVGNNEEERYGNLHKLIASPDLSSCCPVLHKMLKYVNNERFIIVESVNRKSDPHYYRSKMDELCETIEYIRGKSGTMNHPMLKMAQKAFEAGLKELDHKEVLDQEREGRRCLETQLEQAWREQEGRVEDYKNLRGELQREKEEKERLTHKLQEEEDRHTNETRMIHIRLKETRKERDERVSDYESLQEELAREKKEKERIDQRLMEEVNQHTQIANQHAQLINQKQEMQKALQRKQFSPNTLDSGLRVLMKWLEEPQTGPAEFANMMDTLGRPRAELAEVRIQIQDRATVDDSVTSSAVQRGEPVGVQRDDVARGTQKKRWKCDLL